ncbi:copper chaperone PCu(A)C [Marinobacter fonticola]|uniref:copper chaperone PCu(A)C n=1 Tax=Marinobacter fonticola TaxID=2603215 RepID=UPI0011E897A3|nr:copper chaperone PCu(A)C [Marinobacter fonticola]
MQVATRIMISMMLTYAILTASGAMAHESHHQGIQVDQPWARPTPPVKPINGAAYFVISNHGDRAAILEGISTPITDMASMHQTREEGGTLRMGAVEGGLEIAPGETVRFEPNGYHVMLMNLDEPLKEGKSFPLTLKFAQQDNIELDVRIEHGPGSSEAMSAHEH